MNQQTKNLLIQVSSFLLVSLWIYTAGSKIVGYHEFKTQLAGQWHFRENEHIAAVLIISSELIAASLLLFERTRTTGFEISFMMMVLFTIYVGMVLFHYFDKVPCSCGGVLKEMTWEMHFWFNVFFSIVAGLGMFLDDETPNADKAY